MIIYTHYNIIIHIIFGTSYLYEQKPPQPGTLEASSRTSSSTDLPRWPAAWRKRPRSALGREGGLQVVVFPCLPWSKHGVCSWEYHGNIMGISWEYHGNIMGISWEYHGNILEIKWEENGEYGNVQWPIDPSCLMTDEGGCWLVWWRLLIHSWESCFQAAMRMLVMRLISCTELSNIISYLYLHVQCAYSAKWLTYILRYVLYTDTLVTLVYTYTT